MLYYYLGGPRRGSSKNKDLGAKRRSALLKPNSKLFGIPEKLQADRLRCEHPKYI